MIYIDVTHMVEEDSDEMPMLSGSQAELGTSAGKITWNNSVEYGKRRPLLTTDAERNAARVYFAEFGTWDREQITAWSEDELQGIMCQDVAAAVREFYDVAEGDILEYERLCEQGTCSGNLYRGDDGRWYFYVGH